MKLDYSAILFFLFSLVACGGVIIDGDIHYSDTPTLAEIRDSIFEACDSVKHYDNWTDEHSFYYESFEARLCLDDTLSIRVKKYLYPDSLVGDTVVYEW